MASEKPLTAPLAEREATGGGDAMVSGSGSVVLPAGVINPAVPIRNIRMKFAVLIGLIQVGEVSNRDIVETVLNLVSGGESFIICPQWLSSSPIPICVLFPALWPRTASHCLCCCCCCCEMMSFRASKSGAAKISTQTPIQKLHIIIMYSLEELLRASLPFVDSAIASR